MRETNPKPQANARRLRRDQTEVEKKLWSLLRNRKLVGWKFRRQQPIGPYIVDFLCPEAGLIVELDGGQHLEQEEYDLKRTKYLESKGYKVVRYWDNMAIARTKDMLEDILTKLGNPHPDPLPDREREEDKDS